MAAVTSDRQPIGFALRDAIAWPSFVDAVLAGERLGFSTLFVPEISGGREAIATLSGLADRSEGLRLATGVLPLGARRTLLTAMAAATLQERSGGRFVLGLGPGAPVPGALDRLRETVTALRALFHGDTAQVEGRRQRLTIVPDPAPPIWIAALGPRAVRLAGAVADGVLLNWCPPERVQVARRELAEGAADAGRDPGTVTVAAYVRACLGQDEAAALTALRSATGEYASLPAYRRQLAALGLGDDAEAAARAYRAARPAEVPERLVRRLTLLGDPAAARERIAAYREAGLDLPIAYPVLAGEATASIERTLSALAPG
jgi:5,10-methylenetetrahydromethanopterin reductase